MLYVILYLAQQCCSPSPYSGTAMFLVVVVVVVVRQCPKTFRSGFLPRAALITEFSYRGKTFTAVAPAALDSGRQGLAKPTSIVIVILLSCKRAFPEYFIVATIHVCIIECFQ